MVPANHYSSWTVSIPEGASNILLDGSLSTTSCSYAMAIPPPAVYRTFETDRGAINAAGTTLVEWGSTNACGASRIATNIGPGVVGPLHLSSGETLVFWSSAPATAQLSVLAPLEMSYVEPGE